LGDEGRVGSFLSGFNEPLYGVVATAPGDGTVRKTLVPASATIGDDDVIFGGLGSDLIDGGAGDAAISGAEAPAEGYAADLRDGGLLNIVRSDYSRPYNPGGLLHYGLHAANATLAGFALFNEGLPHQRVLVLGADFFLNHDAQNGPKSPLVPSDGD